MNFKEIIQNDKYRLRISKYFGLPTANIKNADDFHRAFYNLAEAGMFDADTVVDAIEHDFNKALAEEPKVDGEFLFEMAHVVEHIQNTIENYENWEGFVNEEIEPVWDAYIYPTERKETPRQVATHVSHYYKEENVGKSYISFDLRTANWQSLQLELGIDEKWSDWARNHNLGYKIPEMSKYFRARASTEQKQVLNLNKYTLVSNLENIVDTVNRFLSKISEDLVISSDSIASIYADEVLLEINAKQRVTLYALAKVLEQEIYNNTGIDVHVTPFKLFKGPQKVYAKVTDVFTPEYLYTGETMKRLITMYENDVDITAWDLMDVNIEDWSAMADFHDNLKNLDMQ